MNVSDCLLHVLTQKVDYFLHNLSTCSSAGEDREIILTFEACFLQGIKVSRPGEFEMHLEDLLGTDKSFPPLCAGLEISEFGTA